MGTKEALGTALERKLNRDTGIALRIPEGENAIRR